MLRWFLVLSSLVFAASFLHRLKLPVSWTKALRSEKSDCKSPFHSQACTNNHCAAEVDSKFVRCPESAIGNFVTIQDNRLIQCNMIGIVDVNGEKIGVGTPLDLPVMLFRFTGRDFEPVDRENPLNEASKPANGTVIYQHLLYHISTQIAGESGEDEVFLCDTPLMLTLHGDLDVDEEADNARLEELKAAQFAKIPAEPIQQQGQGQEQEQGQGQEERSETIECTVEELIKHKNLTLPAILSSPPTNTTIDESDSSVVSDEEAMQLQAEHEVVSLLLESSDVSLLGSFHYKHRNYHLVKVIEVTKQS